ncbi:19437_t:CDS:2 [Dentiscutata erythropus]|uniref:19437_t:CDS:1 n=1 Tax=Dentiscutata erythropus TaxID=1348616 RepID=A0A9N8VI70_9GLOM|nr:19437_t:CDS:2 [Dentiscutata erythropus]
MKRKDQYEHRKKNDYREKKKDTDPNNKIQDVKIFRCKDKGFVDDDESDKSKPTPPILLGWVFKPAGHSISNFISQQMSSTTTCINS